MLPDKPGLPGAGWLALGPVLLALTLTGLTISVFESRKLHEPFAGETLPSFETTACNGFDLPDNRPVECGWLRVAQTRLPDGTPAPGTRVVIIPVAILKATDPSPKPDPVVFLDGGPGYGTLETMALNFTSTDWPQARPGGPAVKPYATPDRDWIFFDQRGTGDSMPSLGCNMTGGVFEDGLLETARLCDDWHRATGVDTTAYNGAAIARDLADLRQVLGYDAWNLVGVSYGTRTALVSARDAPAGLRAMVLDAVAPPGLKLVETDTVNMAGMVRKVLDACTADTGCNSAFPDLTRRFEDALTEWTTPEALAAWGGRTRMEDLSFFLGVTLYDPVGLESLPADLASILDGDRRVIEETNKGFDGAASGSIMGHYCSEIMPFETYDGMRRRAAADPIARALAAITEEKAFNDCEQWPTGPVRQIEALPVRSVVPALLMSAGIDPGTPASNAAFAARTLSRAQIVVAETATHGISFSNACGRSIMQAFLAAPDVPVDTRCLADEQTSIRFLLPEP